MNILALLFSNFVQAAEVSVMTRGHASNPVWSANGSKLAFEVNDYAGKISLFTVDVENGEPRDVPRQVSLSTGGLYSDSSGIVASPVWHPQGYLIFEALYAGGNARIYMESHNTVTEVVDKTTLNGDLSWPTLSSDGETVVFVSDATGQGDVYSYTIRGKNLKHLVDTSNSSEMAPRLNPDGELVFTHKKGGGEDLYVLSSGATAPKHHIGGNGDQTRPIWAGDSLVFFSNERGTDLWDVVVAGDSKSKRVLSKNVRLPFRSPPALSPDKKWVAYGLNDPRKSEKIWFTKLDGSKTVAFNTGHVACGEPNLTEINGQVYLAYTALPAEGSAWRQLHIRDVTSLLK